MADDKEELESIEENVKRFHHGIVNEPDEDEDEDDLENELYIFGKGIEHFGFNPIGILGGLLGALLFEDFVSSIDDEDEN